MYPLSSSFVGPSRNMIYISSVCFSELSLFHLYFLTFFNASFLYSFFLPCSFLSIIPLFSLRIFLLSPWGPPKILPALEKLRVFKRRNENKEWKEKEKKKTRGTHEMESSVLLLLTLVHVILRKSFSLMWTLIQLNPVTTDVKGQTNFIHSSLWQADLFDFFHF